MKRSVLLLALAALVNGCSHQVPTGQPPLAAMNLEEFRSAFNSASANPRLILLLSPT